jgi:hypothetical protein
MSKEEKKEIKIKREGEEVTSMHLSRSYDRCAKWVLSDYLEEQPRERKQRRKYIAKKDLPTKDEYKKLKTIKYTENGDVAIERAQGEIEGVKDELQEWLDNLESHEGLSQTGTADILRTAVDELDYVDFPEFPEASEEYLKKVQVYQPPNLSKNGKVRTGRESRLGESAGRLQVVHDELSDMINRQQIPKSLVDDLQEWVDNIESVIESIEGVECPTML